MELDRRTFLKGAAGAGLVVAAATGMAACTPSTGGGAGTQGDNGGASGAGGSTGLPSTNPADYEVVATYTADIVCVGAGMGGLSAAVEARQNGASCILIEQTGYAGAGACGVEGMFSINADVQIAEGYTDVKPVEFVKIEMDYHHNRVDGTKWMHLIENSGENVNWLIENGCLLPTLHRFGAAFDSDRCLKGFVRPMLAKAQELGAEVLFNTTVCALTWEDDKVSGLIAQKFDGNYIRVKAPVVVLATGGYARNDEYLRESGFFAAEDVVRFIPVIMNGDAITLARSVGGADILNRATALQTFSLLGAPGGEYGTFGNANALVVTTRSPNTLWVNQDGERICDEDSGKGNWMALMIPALVHKKVYSIYDQAVWEKVFAGGPTAYENTKRWQYDDEKSIAQFNARFEENPYNDSFKADTLEELAEIAAKNFEGMDKDTLLATIKNYNAMCAAGEDTAFGKDAVNMQELKNPPYYMIYMPMSVMVTYGALATSKDFEVVNDHRQAIPGLYSAGVDACDLWPNIYTINVGGGTAANHVHSGRVAVRSGIAYIGENNLLGSIASEGDTSPSVVPYHYDQPDTLKDGTYVSKPYFGMFSDITATVTISDGKIAKITQENELETPYVGVYAIDDIIAEVIETQSVNVDTVAGATSSSNAIRAAISDSLMQSAG
jgi:fumarate reductase flavoprotein subunit